VQEVWQRYGGSKKEKWRIIMKNVLFKERDIVKNSEKAEKAVE